VLFQNELNLFDAFVREGQDPVVIVKAIDPDGAVRSEWPV